MSCNWIPYMVASSLVGGTESQTGQPWLIFPRLFSFFNEAIVARKHPRRLEMEFAIVLPSRHVENGCFRQHRCLWQLIRIHVGPGP